MKLTVKATFSQHIKVISLAGRGVFGGFLLAMLMSFQNANAGDSTNVFLVEEASLECLIANVDAYLALEKDPVLVFLDFCPEVTPDKNKIYSIAENSLPNLKTTAKLPGTHVSHIIVLTHDEIRCLSNLAAKGMLILHHKRAKSEKSTILISLDKCAPGNSVKANGGAEQ